MEIEFEVRGTGLDIIYRALRVEGPVALRNGRLYMRFECDEAEITRLRAMVNTWLRLLKIASEMVEISKGCNSINKINK